MKLLTFLLLSFLVIGLHANSTTIDSITSNWEDLQQFQGFKMPMLTGEIVEWMKQLRNGGAGERIKVMIDEQITSSFAEPYNALLAEVNHKAIAIFEATVPVASNPTPAKLKELSGDFVQSVRKIGRVWEERSKTADEVSAVVSNTALWTATEEVHASNLSPSKFANAFKQSNDSTFLYEFAAFVRCQVDEEKAFPQLAKSTWEARGEILKQRSKKCVEELPITEELEPRLDLMGQKELLEFFSSQKNVESVVNEFWILMQALRNSSSYESEAAFLSNIEGSKRLKAIALLFNEARRCVKTAEIAYFPLLDECRSACVDSLKRVFGEEELSDQKLDLGNLRMVLTLAQLGETINETLFTKDFGPGSKFAKCMSVEGEFENITLVFNGVEADEAKMLKEMEKKSPKAHALLLLFYEHLHALRNRDEMNDEANAFLTQVFTKWSEYREADDSTDAGKAIQERTSAELRSSFLGLSNETKKIFASHFPHRTIALLSALF